MRVLDKANINYSVLNFPDTIHSADGVAEYFGVPKNQVYKTLVVQALGKGKPCLIMVAGDRELDLKRLAVSLGVKKVSMVTQVEAERKTQLKVGGISALALLNRGMKIYLDKPALTMESIVVSAGQRGVNIRLPVHDLIRVTGAIIIEGT